MFDWQNVLVALIVSAACLYAGRRAWARLRSMCARGPSACETSCGKCGSDEPKTATTPAKILVQIGRRNTTSRSRTR